VKILSVVEAFCHGGAQTVLLDVVLSLPEHQHRVVHFSTANSIAAETTFVDALRSHDIDCIDAHWDSIRNEKLRTEILDGFRPDVVLFHWWGKDPWMPWVVSRQPGSPAFVCVMHHNVIAAKGGYDRYVLVSRSQLQQVDHIPPDRVQVIPNGIDLERFPTRIDRRSPAFDARDRPFVVGRLSELREGKIPDGWIRTLASYRLENTRFVIAGGGALLPALRKSAIDLKLDGQMFFPGYIPRREVPSLLETFDAFCYVTSSAVECCPLAILEAMAAGVPVVAEARGGIPEIVVSGENGLLGRSLDEIGDHLRRLRENPTLREHLGRGARATAEKFSLKKQIAAYRDLLADLQRESA
jgi:glycosyltransferase involved in cell wall biosynthesis